MEQKEIDSGSSSLVSGVYFTLGVQCFVTLPLVSLNCYCLILGSDKCAEPPKEACHD